MTCSVINAMQLVTDQAGTRTQSPDQCARYCLLGTALQTSSVSDRLYDAYNDVKGFSQSRNSINCSNKDIRFIQESQFHCIFK